MCSVSFEMPFIRPKTNYAGLYTTSIPRSSKCGQKRFRKNSEASCEGRGRAGINELLSFSSRIETQECFKCKIEINYMPFLILISYSCYVCTKLSCYHVTIFRKAPNFLRKFGNFFEKSVKSHQYNLFLVGFC